MNEFLVCLPTNAMLCHIGLNTVAGFTSSDTQHHLTWKLLHWWIQASNWNVSHNLVFRIVCRCISQYLVVKYHCNWCSTIIWGTRTQLPSPRGIPLGECHFMKMMQDRYMERRIQQKPLDWIDYMHIAGDHTQDKTDDNVFQPLTLFNKACGQVSSNEPEHDNISTEGNYDDLEDILLDDLNTCLFTRDPNNVLVL